MFHYVGSNICNLQTKVSLRDDYAMSSPLIWHKTLGSVSPLHLVFMSFGIAVNDRRRNPETGEWEEFPNFFNCTMFGTRGEQLGELLAKGDKVVIEGSLRYSQWETKDGQHRSNIEIIIEEVEFMRVHAFE